MRKQIATLSIHFSQDRCYHSS